MQNFVYLVGDPHTKEAAVVDAAWDVDHIVRTAEADGYKITQDLVTHFHPDHLGGDLMGHQIIGAVELLARVPAKVVIHKAELPFVHRLTGLSSSDLIPVEGGVDVGYLTYMIYAGRHFAEHDGWSYEEKDGFENKDLLEILHGNLFVRHEYADWWHIDTGLRSSLFLHFDSSDDDAATGVFAGAYATAMFGWKHFKLGPRVQAGIFYEHEGEFGVFLQPVIGRIAFSW